MPKSKIIEKSSAKPIEKKVIKPILGVGEEKIIEIDTEEKVLPDELIPGESEGDDTEDEDETIDDDEVDPFKDKWEQ